MDKSNFLIVKYICGSRVFVNTLGEIVSVKDVNKKRVILFSYDLWGGKKMEFCDSIEEAETFKSTLIENGYSCNIYII